MEKVIPRWEFRTFGDAFRKAEVMVRKSGEAEVRSGAETYVVSLNSPNNTRIRHGVLGVKRLERVDTHRLERWNPFLRVEFPVAAALLPEVFAAWGIAHIDLSLDLYTIDQLLSEVVKPHPRLRSVAVEKERSRFEVDGCIVEIANVKFNGHPFRTASVEAVDPDLVTATVIKLGLEKLENVSYVTALRRFLVLPGA
jgi:exopolyphosphatase/guanosine-5'-triphosphate,3'-diphosphate pyrophosphatase